MASQPVVFTTQTQYPLPSQKFMIPTSWKRYQLSQLVNKALSLEKPVPFDFLVRGELLHTTLSEWCSENGVGEEETLEIEYIESIMPPQKMSDFPHEDWVSSVSCQVQDFVRWPNTRVRLFKKPRLDDNGTHSANNLPLRRLRRRIDLHHRQLVARPHRPDHPNHPRRLALLEGALLTPPAHRPVSSVSANTAGTHLLTSSWDGLIGFWDTTVPTADEVPEPVLNERDRKKRRRIEAAAKPLRKAPLLVLKSHTARVSKVRFANDETKAVSCGFDSTVRMWNTEYGVCEHTINAAEKPFLDLALTRDGSSALAVSTDRTMTLYDLRASPTALAAAAATFQHPSTPACVAASERNGHQVVTGAYDGVVRVWDVRSTKGAVASFKAWAGAKKVLGVDWRRGVVGVGGEGGLEVWRVGEEAVAKA
ncbi:ribosome biogenesis protein YTM1 [Pholiota molesta]|nr:ribosome biogenesis protein YTM1 [Pholiota molesta]